MSYIWRLKKKMLGIFCSILDTVFLFQLIEKRNNCTRNINFESLPIKCIFVLQNRRLGRINIVLKKSSVINFLF